MVQVDARDVQIAQLEKRLEAALERIAQLEQENERLREENRRLKERLGLNLSNSSKPPSSDPPPRHCAPAQEAHGPASRGAAWTQEA